MDQPSQDLLKKALFLLAYKYNIDVDSFFLVLTKDGKVPEESVYDQTIIGELNVKSLVAFIVQAINQLCGSVDMNPHIFISRYLTGAFLEQERLQSFDSLGGQPFIDEDLEEDDFFEDEGEDEEDIVYSIPYDWEEIKN
jgi:hypothetical protein